MRTEPITLTAEEGPRQGNESSGSARRPRLEWLSG